MRRKTLTICCSECGREIYRYVKLGKGNVWHCWKKRILEDHSVQTDNKVRCPCGNLIGIDERIWIKLKHYHVTIS